MQAPTSFIPGRAPSMQCSARANSSILLFLTPTTTTKKKNKSILSPITKAVLTNSQVDQSTKLTAPPLPPQKPLKKVRSDSLKYESGYVGAVPDKLLESSNGGPNPVAYPYLTDILNSNVYDVAIESPLDYAPKVSQRLGAHVWLKREDLQPVRLLFILIIEL